MSHKPTVIIIRKPAKYFVGFFMGCPKPWFVSSQSTYPIALEGVIVTPSLGLCPYKATI
jgi:hypothetical protein